MSSIEEVVNANRLDISVESARNRQTESTPNSILGELLLRAPPQISNNRLHSNESNVAGTIKEFSPVGDGRHLVRRPLPLLPFIEHSRPRTQTLVRKVTVVGSYVLRYVTRNSNLFMRRQQRQNYQRPRLARIDQHMNYESAYNSDPADIVWLNHNEEQPVISNLGLLRSQEEPSTERLLTRSNIVSRSLLGLFNWRIYVGMICIIIAQTLLKLSFQQIFNMN